MDQNHIETRPPLTTYESLAKMIDHSLVRPELTVEEYEEKHGGPLYVLQPDQCCRDRKLAPVKPKTCARR